MNVGELIEELKKMPKDEYPMISDCMYMLGICDVIPGKDKVFGGVVLKENYQDTGDLTTLELISKLSSYDLDRIVYFFDTNAYYTPCKVKVIDWEMSELKGKILID